MVGLFAMLKPGVWVGFRVDWINIRDPLCFLAYGFLIFMVKRNLFVKCIFLLS